MRLHRTAATNVLAMYVVAMAGIQEPVGSQNILHIPQVPMLPNLFIVVYFVHAFPYGLTSHTAHPRGNNGGHGTVTGHNGNTFWYLFALIAPEDKATALGVRKHSRREMRPFVCVSSTIDSSKHQHCNGLFIYRKQNKINIRQ